jgi:glycerol-3-phosphate dehydrogenase
MTAAEISRPPLTITSFDVLVIGGGINGIAIARECARGGKQTLLLEQHDFASGTTSRSTRIIHGGLRYLEHGELGLVRESLRERNRLLCERPHLVRPTRFVLALPNKHNLFSRRGALAVRAGLSLYGVMASQPCPMPNVSLERELDLGKDFAVFDYEDAQCEFPERLAAEWLVEAMRYGAVARNYTKVLSIRPGAKRLSARIRDAFSGIETSIEAKHIVNASGPWVDEVCAAALLDTKRLISGVRGSHILVDRFPGAPNDPIYTEASDRRPFFIIPWNGQLLVGTTEVRHDQDPGAAQATQEEISYLIAGFNRMFARHRINTEDVCGTFSGVRPLPNTGDRAEYGSVTRRSFIHDHHHDGFPGLYSIIGGKLTTAASLGRQCARTLGVRSEEVAVSLVAVGPASGFDNTLAHWSNQMANRCRISPEAALAAAEWHGRTALSVLRRAMSDRSLAQPIVAGSDHLLAEAVHAVQRESAVTLADILLRRVPIALTGLWIDEQSAEAGKRIGRALGWSEGRIARESETFVAERERLIGVGRGSRAPLPAEHAA